MHFVSVAGAERAVTSAGSYSDRVSATKQLSYLPEQYWASGMVHNDAVANNMNVNVPNPFLLGNFAGLKTSSSTSRTSQLLRIYPLMTGLSQSYAPYGEVRTNALEISFERRFSNRYLSHGLAH